MEENQKIIELLDRLESKLKQRIPKVEVRSPERLFEELDALELVIDKAKVGKLTLESKPMSFAWGGREFLRGSRYLKGSAVIRCLF